jgi:hypothetical protein
MEVDLEAIVKEAGSQYAALFSKYIVLAGQLSAAQKKNAELEKKLEEKSA